MSDETRKVYQELKEVTGLLS